MENLMHQKNIIPARHSSSENMEKGQPQYSLDEEPEKEIVSLAPAQTPAEQNNEVIYGIINTTVNNIPLTILVDSGAASSHITEKAVNETKSPTHPRKKPLQVVGFGNVESKIIDSFTVLTLVGVGGETIDVPFNINQNQILSSIPGVTSAIFDDYPHLAQHRYNLSAPIPRPDQGVDGIIGLRDIAKIFPKGQDKNEKCPEICYMKRADGTENVLEARKTIFGTMIYGGVNNNHKQNNENKPISTAQGNVEIHDKEPENILNIKETPLDISLKKVVDTQGDDKLASSEEDKSALQKRAHDEFINETVRISNHDGTSRYKIKLSRLPEHLYPNKVDGLKISGTAINRFISLENRLQHP